MVMKKYTQTTAPSTVQGVCCKESTAVFDSTQFGWSTNNCQIASWNYFDANDYQSERSVYCPSASQTVIWGGGQGDDFEEAEMALSKIKYATDANGRTHMILAIRGYTGEPQAIKYAWILCCDIVQNSNPDVPIVQPVVVQSVKTVQERSVDESVHCPSSTELLLRPSVECRGSSLIYSMEMSYDTTKHIYSMKPICLPQYGSGFDDYPLIATG
ncbi:MAG: hypothetical protein P4L81_02655 [Candidatus Pacebacteria bacterium]|nr:hypothetical protein [Candidatus Paceibacterota bacterium]